MILVHLKIKAVKENWKHPRIKAVKMGASLVKKSLQM